MDGAVQRRGEVAGFWGESLFLEVETFFVLGWMENGKREFGGRKRRRR